MSTMSQEAPPPHPRRPRREFTKEFKAQAVRLMLDEGKSMNAVARELDLAPTALGEWVKHARADRTGGRTGLTTAEREELARLRKENRILAEEREILTTAGGLLREAESMRFRFIAAEQVWHTITILCRCLRVTRSGFYTWQRRPASAHAPTARQLRDLVRASFEASRHRYWP